LSCELNLSDAEQVLLLLLRLEDVGAVMTLNGSALRIEPGTALTDSDRVMLRADADTAKGLMLLLDAGIQARLKALAEARVPSLARFSCAEPWNSSQCPCCGEAVTKVGRCWRCSAAWPLASGLTMTQCFRCFSRNADHARARICSVPEPVPAPVPDLELIPEPDPDSQRTEVSAMDIIAKVSKHVTAEELKASGPKNFTVFGCEMVKFDEGDRPALLVEDQRLLYMNKTRSEALASAWGPETDAWLGRRLRASYDPTIKFGSQTRGGIKVEPLPDKDVPF
jgi:hypothetical protein